MNRFTKLAITGFACLAATACGSIPKRTFQIDVLTTAEKPNPCLVVVDGNVAAALRAKQYVNVKSEHAPLDLEVAFVKKSVKITVIPVELTDGEGSAREVIDPPQSMPLTDSHNSRSLIMTDVPLQGFIPKKYAEQGRQLQHAAKAGNAGRDGEEQTNFGEGTGLVGRPIHHIARTQDPTEPDIGSLGAARLACELHASPQVPCFADPRKVRKPTAGEVGLS